MQLSLAFSRRFRASIGLDYAHSKISDIHQQTDSGQEQTLQAAVGFEYLLTRSVTCYVRGLRSQVISEDAASSYARDQGILGFSVQF